MFWWKLSNTSKVPQISAAVLNPTFNLRGNRTTSKNKHGISVTICSLVCLIEDSRSFFNVANDISNKAITNKPKSLVFCEDLLLEVYYNQRTCALYIDILGGYCIWFCIVLLFLKNMDTFERNTAHFKSTNTLRHKLGCQKMDSCLFENGIHLVYTVDDLSLDG